jgi:hypothetical protein
MLQCCNVGKFKRYRVAGCDLKPLQQISKMIIRRNHQVNNYAGDRYLQPDRECPAYQLFMFFNLHLQPAVKAEQYKGQNTGCKYDMRREYHIINIPHVPRPCRFRCRQRTIPVNIPKFGFRGQVVKADVRHQEKRRKAKS